MLSPNALYTDILILNTHVLTTHKHTYTHVTDEYINNTNVQASDIITTHTLTI